VVSAFLRLFIWATVGLLIDGWHQFPKSAPDEQL
jgi:hypothetical protein